MNGYPRILFTIFILQLCWLQVRGQTDSAKRKIVIADILPQGNKITQASIIFRELTFKKGDTILVSHWGDLAKRSEQNLMNTQLFNHVQIDTVRLANGELDAMVELVERWYIWPSPIFRIEERNFNTWLEQNQARLDKVDYGAFVTWYNVLGLRQTLRVAAQFGYTKQFGAGYAIPYITKKQAGGLAFNFAYSENREMPYTSVNNELTYLHYPDQILQKQYTGSIDFTYRKGLYNTHILEADFFSCSVADTIRKLTNEYLPFNLSKATFFELKYFFKSDYRDYAPYPLIGYYFDFSINEYGLGMKLDNQPFNLLYVQSSFHKYWSISPYFYYSADLEGKVSQNGTQPYYLQRGLGYSNSFVRGYELYVIDGNNYALVKNEIKCRLLHKPLQPIPLIPARQFNVSYYSVFLTAFADWAYVGAPNPNVENNFLADSPLLGYGFGVDFITYYDLVLRVEYSFNRLGQSGFFLHFVAPM